MSLKIFLSIFLLLFTNTLFASSNESFEIVKKSFNMWRGENSSIATFTMAVIRPDRTTSMTLKFWSKGDYYSIGKFQAPPRYKGQAILVDHDSMWTYSAKSNRSIKIANSLKSQAWMGSDMSYDDISITIDMLKDYTYKMLPSEHKNGEEIYVIEATPFKNAPIVWGKEVYKIKKSDNSLVSKDFYDQSGKAVKRFVALKVGFYKGNKAKPIMEHMRVFNLEKEGYYTDFIMKDVTLDVTIDNKIFSLSNLSKPS